MNSGISTINRWWTSYTALNAAIAVTLPTAAPAQAATPTQAYTATIAQYPVVFTSAPQPGDKVRVDARYTTTDLREEEENEYLILEQNFPYGQKVLTRYETYSFDFTTGQDAVSGAIGNLTGYIQGGVRPSSRREMAQWAVAMRGASIRQACADFTLSETCYRYRPKRVDENRAIADWLVRLTHNQKNWGFGLCFLHLRNVKGFGWNRERVYRIYRELALNLRIKPKQRIVREKPRPLAVPTSINQIWWMDFMHDRLRRGHRFRLFNVLDDYNREGLGIEADLSLPAARVIRSLDRIIEWRGRPAAIRCDNGPEYISGALLTWAKGRRIQSEHIQPGKP